MNNWERMKAGRLYNADSKDLEQYHKFGMETCDKFNRTPLWRKKRKQRLLEKLIPSAKDGGAAIFAPFYCEYGVNIHFGKGCFVNVPMYNTNIPCTPAGVFSGNMVVSMRPIPYAQVPAAVAITAGMPRVHGAPVQIGTPEAIGITDLAHPDYGDAVTIRPGETPVFWPCGVTPQAVVMHSKPAFCITHAPGHMFITDVKNTALKF